MGGREPFYRKPFAAGCTGAFVVNRTLVAGKHEFPPGACQNPIIVERTACGVLYGVILNIRYCVGAYMHSE